MDKKQTTDFPVGTLTVLDEKTFRQDSEFLKNHRGKLFRVTKHSNLPGFGAVLELIHVDDFIYIFPEHLLKIR